MSASATAASSGGGEDIPPRLLREGTAPSNCNCHALLVQPNLCRRSPKRWRKGSMARGSVSAEEGKRRARVAVHRRVPKLVRQFAARGHPFTCAGAVAASLQAREVLEREAHSSPCGRRGRSSARRLPAGCVIIKQLVPLILKQRDDLTRLEDVAVGHWRAVHGKRHACRLAPC
eukprot:scaffold323390_cov24-Tisochrysis_lutea.AAC.4